MALPLSIYMYTLKTRRLPLQSSQLTRLRARPGKRERDKDSCNRPDLGSCQWTLASESVRLSLSLLFSPSSSSASRILCGSPRPDAVTRSFSPLLQQQRMRSARLSSRGSPLFPFAKRAFVLLGFFFSSSSDCLYGCTVLTREATFWRAASF